MDAGEKTGRTFLVTKGGRNVKWMREAGFAGELFVKNHKMPIGTWPRDGVLKEVGAFNLVACEQGLEGFAVYLGTQVMGYEIGELERTFAGMRRCLRNQAYHAYYPASMTWTQKPLGS